MKRRTFLRSCSSGIVFFFHDKSANSVFQPTYRHSRTGPKLGWLSHWAEWRGTGNESREFTRPSLSGLDASGLAEMGRTQVNWMGGENWRSTRGSHNGTRRQRRHGSFSPKPASGNGDRNPNSPHVTPACGLRMPSRRNRNKPPPKLGVTPVASFT
jgi:hypothetical protein